MANATVALIFQTGIFFDNQWLLKSLSLIINKMKLHHYLRDECWNKRGSDMTQLSFNDNKSINIQ
jgi:hypothetical protein